MEPKREAWVPRPCPCPCPRRDWGRLVEADVSLEEGVAPPRPKKGVMGPWPSHCRTDV